MQFINEHVTYYGFFFRLVGQIGHVSNLYYKTNSIYADEKKWNNNKINKVYFFVISLGFILYFEFKI